MNFKSLNEITKQFMLDEINLDIKNSNLYLSNRLNELGKANYAGALLESVKSGDISSLERWIANHLNPSDFRQGRPVKMPPNAAQLLAEGEFNRFYMRALCSRVIQDGCGELLIYRARFSANPRPESDAKIGQLMNAHTLLNDLRENIGIETILGLPQVNSGLSIELRVT